MIIEGVPFYWDTEDGTHCFQAVLKMILKYFLPDKDYLWSALREMTGKKDEMYTWPQRGYISMIELDFEIKIIDKFDFDKFIEHGVGYLIEEYGGKVAKDQEENSDIKYEIDNIKKLKGVIVKEDRVPTIEDIKTLLTDNYLVDCGINPYILRGEDGVAMHSVLIIGFNDDSLILHDPGFAKGDSLEINNDIFNQAWAYPNENIKGIAAYKLK